MPALTSTILWLLFVVTASEIAGAQSPRLYCHSDSTDRTVEYLLRRAKQIGTDPAEVFEQVRDSIWKIKRQSPSDIALVSDETICQRAAMAYDADVPFDGVVRERRVVVIRLGADYLVLDPTQQFGEWYTGIILDTSFARKSWGRFGV